MGTYWAHTQDTTRVCCDCQPLIILVLMSSLNESVVIVNLSSSLLWLSLLSLLLSSLSSTLILTYLFLMSRISATNFYVWIRGNYGWQELLEFDPQFGKLAINAQVTHRDCDICLCSYEMFFLLVQVCVCLCLCFLLLILSAALFLLSQVTMQVILIQRIWYLTRDQCTLHHTYKSMFDHFGLLFFNSSLFILVVLQA